jgi:GNAT superfamily N-acetyltransferase
MNLHMRTYQDENDYWHIRAFLRDVFLLNGRREQSWQAYRFDCWRRHSIENLIQGPLEETVYLWETSGGQIAALLNPEGPGEVYLQVHPSLRTPELEEEMITVAEQHLATPAPGGRQTLRVWCSEEDTQRQEILMHHGYGRSDWPEFQRRRSFEVPLPNPPAPAGYTVRALGGVEELPARSWASWKAFHPNEPDDAYQGWEWYANIQHAPLYRRDLDMVAVTPNGEVASFCTAWFDDVTRTGAFEPVGTVPAHQRRGLGKVVMAEGLRRLARLGATLATVGSYNAPAHALYASMGFVDYDLSEPWAKNL